MLQGLINTLASAYVEIVILFILLLVFVKHRRDSRLVVSGVRIVRTLVMLMIFFYFMFVWASAVKPTLRNISIFGMFVINLIMLYNLLLAWLERPYRDALAAMTRSRKSMNSSIMSGTPAKDSIICAMPGLPCSAAPIPFISCMTWPPTGFGKISKTPCATTGWNRK